MCQCLQTVVCGVLPRRIELLLCVSEQSAVLVHEQAPCQGTGAQAGQDGRRAMAGNESCERARHVHYYVLWSVSQKSLKRKREEERQTIWSL